MAIHPSLLWLALLLAAPPTAEDLIARYEKERAPVWSDGEVATFFYQGNAEKVEAYFAGQRLSLHHLSGSDVWTRAVRKPQLEKAVFTYAIVPVRKDPGAGMGGGFGSIWRGPKAPPAPEIAKPLAGTIRSELFDSQALGEKRRVHVYLPPGHDPAQPCRVVYSTDGQLHAEVLEPLIVAGDVLRVMVIAPEAARSPGRAAVKASNPMENDLRGQEYVPGFNQARFSRHEAFYCRELLNWAEKEYGASRDRSQRVVTGCSYGARFAVEMGVRHPDLFGNVFAFSVAGFYTNTIPRFERPPVQLSPPRFFLAAGTWEQPLYPTAKNVAEGLRRQRFPVVFSTRVAGHDNAMWREEFVSAIVQVFGKK